MLHARPSLDNRSTNPWYLGGDQSPLNDSDADEGLDPNAYLELDLEDLDLDEFRDSDKFDSAVNIDIGSGNL